MSQQLSHGMSHDVIARTRGLTRSVDDITLALRSAALSADHTACADVLARARLAELNDGFFADVCIPQAARLLGEDWVSDALSFAEVSIATARLQGLLRHLGADWQSDQAAPADAPTVLVVVPEPVQHTLGPSVLVSQLRRRGLSVGLLLRATRSDVGAYLRRTPPSAVFVSVSCVERLELARPIVTQVRQSAPGVPVVIGGPATIACGDARALTGADHATSDASEALVLCGLMDLPRRTMRAETMI